MACRTPCFPPLSGMTCVGARSAWPGAWGEGGSHDRNGTHSQPGRALCIRPTKLNPCNPISATISGTEVVLRILMPKKLFSPPIAANGSPHPTITATTFSSSDSWGCRWWVLLCPLCSSTASRWLAAHALKVQNRGRVAGTSAWVPCVRSGCERSTTSPPRPSVPGSASPSLFFQRTS